MLDDISPVFEKLVREWLEISSLLDILEDNDLDEETLLHILLREGHIIPPPYLESLVEYEDGQSD